MNHPTQQPPSAETLLETIGHYIEQCRRELAEGRQIDLSGLDGQVDALCEEVAKLPAETAEKLQPRMQELMGELTDLGKKLEEARMEVQRQLEGLNLRQKANKAYSTTSASKPEKPGGGQG